MASSITCFSSFSCFDDLDELALRCLMSYIPLQQRLQLRSLNRKCLRAIDSLSIKSVRFLIYRASNLKCKVNDVGLARLYPFWKLEKFSHITNLTISGNIEKLDLSSLKQLTTLKLEGPRSELKNLFVKPCPSVQVFTCFHYYFISRKVLQQFPNLVELNAHGLFFDTSFQQVFPKIRRLTCGFDNQNSVIKKFPNLEYLTLNMDVNEDKIFKYIKNLHHLETIQIQSNKWILNCQEWCISPLKPLWKIPRKIHLRFAYRPDFCSWDYGEEEDAVKTCNQIDLVRKSIEILTPYFKSITFYDWTLTCPSEWDKCLKLMLTLIGKDKVIYQHNLCQLQQMDRSDLSLVNDLLENQLSSYSIHSTSLPRMSPFFSQKINFLSINVAETNNWSLKVKDFPYLTRLTLICPFNNHIDFSFLFEFKHLEYLNIKYLTFDDSFLNRLFANNPKLTCVDLTSSMNVNIDLNSFYRFMSEKARKNPHVLFDYHLVNCGNSVVTSNELIRQKPKNLNILCFDTGSSDDDSDDSDLSN